MTEYIYIVTYNDEVLGSFSDIERATIFVEGYFIKYYNEPFELTIRRVPKNEEKADD